jgi:hypothetical protein
MCAQLSKEPSRLTARLCLPTPAQEDIPQEWSYAAGQLEGIGTANGNAGMCLDVKEAATEPGTLVDLWAERTLPGQRRAIGRRRQTTRDERVHRGEPARIGTFVNLALSEGMHHRGAAEMGTSVHTFGSHLRSIYQKLQERRSLP